MPEITFIESNGQETAVIADNEVSLMEGAVDNMVEGIVAECGGFCICGTCHVFIDESWQAKMEKPDSFEQDLLGLVKSADSRSRLSCQIQINPDLDGLVVHLPESQK